MRRIPIPKRQPTEAEMWETVSDAQEHRIMNNERTLQDIKDKYLGKLKLVYTGEYNVKDL